MAAANVAMKDNLEKSQSPPGAGFVPLTVLVDPCLPNAFVDRRSFGLPLFRLTHSAIISRNPPEFCAELHTANAPATLGFHLSRAGPHR